MGCGPGSLQALELVPNAQVVFTIPPGAPTLISTRVGEGYNYIAGFAEIVTPIPPGAIVRVSQSMDGLTFPYFDDFPLTGLPPFTTTWNVVVLARYVRVEVINLTPVPLVVGIHGLLKTG